MPNNATTVTLSGGSHAEKLGSHSVYYAAGSVVALTGSILMLPVYTHALSPAEYGLLETALRFVQLWIVVAFVGLRQGYLRFYFDSTEQTWQKTLTSTILVGVAFIGVTVVLPLLLAASFLPVSLGLLQTSKTNSILLAVWVTFEAIYTVGLSFMQVRFLSAKYLIAQIARVSLLIGSTFVMLNVFKLGLNGALIGNLATAVLSGLVAGVLLTRWAGTKISIPTLKELVRFGLPYIPTAIFAYVITNADRLSLLNYGFAATLGYLALASKFGEMALSVLSSPFENIWMPYAFSVHNEPDGPKKIGLLFMRYVAAMIFIALLISLAAPLVISLLAPKNYAETSNLVPLVAIGCMFFNASSLSDIGILITKNTRLKPWIFGAVAVIAISLQALLTPRAGVVGAITATTLTAIAQYLIISSVSGRYFRFHIDSRTMLIIIGSAALALFVGREISTTLPTFLGNLIAIIVGMGSYSLAVHSSGLLTFNDARQLVMRPLKRKSA